MSLRALLVSLFFATTATAGDVAIQLHNFGVARPGAQHFLGATVSNRTENATDDIHVRITFDPSIVVEEVRHHSYLWQCATKPGEVECTNPAFTLGADGTIAMTVRVPASPAGGDFVINGTVTTKSEDPNLANNSSSASLHVLRQLIVSNANDSGEGSLRKAIVDANVACNPPDRPCEIRFRLPELRTVIEPLSPLAPITACAVVVGDPPLFFGDAIPVQAVISGRRITAPGPGLELRSACSNTPMHLYGVAVTGFPEDGIAINAPYSYVLNGFEVTGNGRRGIVSNVNAWLLVQDSVIGGNVRSGIALFEGQATLIRSRIGIDRDGRDLGNGASGVYVAPGAFGVHVHDSVIAYNAHYGLALAGRTDVSFTSSTVIKYNISDVDWFLDGPSAPRRSNIPPTPRVLSAAYEPSANVTRVTFTVDFSNTTADSNYDVRLYASDRTTILGTAHLETVAGTRWIPAGETIAPSYTVELKGDYRGRYLSAVTTAWTVQVFPDSPSPTMRNTSEVSVAVKVE